MIVVLAMIVILVIAAFAVDLGRWYQQHHQAQVSADAAALAAANYMGHGGAEGTATGTATTIAGANGLPISSSNVSVDTTKETVTVTVPTSGALSFAGISLAAQPNIAARAVATWAQTDCSVTGARCAFMFAADPVCNSDTGVSGYVKNKTSTIQHGITIGKNGTGAGITLNGAVVSASNITTSVDGNPSFNTLATYSNGTGCTGPSPSSPSPYSGAFTRAVSSQYPIDYSKIYSACGTTSSLFGSVGCTNGFPSYCTVTSTAATYTISSTTTNAIYCDAGSGTTSDPSTWNGTIVQNQSGNASYIAGTVKISLPTNSTMGPAANNYLLAYAASCNASTPPPTNCNASPTTTSPAVDISSSGNATISGDVFAPAGTIDSHLAGNPNITGFLEGWDVVYNADGTATGGGPTVDSSDQFLYDMLTE